MEIEGWIERGEEERKGDSKEEWTEGERGEGPYTSPSCVHNHTDELVDIPRLRLDHQNNTMHPSAVFPLSPRFRFTAPPPPSQHNIPVMS